MTLNVLEQAYQKKLDDTLFTEAKIKKKNLIITLDTLTHSPLDVDTKDSVSVNPYSYSQFPIPNNAFYQTITTKAN